MRNNHALTRRTFLRGAIILGAQSALPATGLLESAAGADAGGAGAPPDLAVAKGTDPVRNCLAAVEAIGGFPRFVKPGNRVVIKPNPIGRSRPDQALNTHPDMIEAVVRECLRAGARKIAVVSHDSERDMAANGTAQAVIRGGGEIKALDDVEMYREAAVPRGRILRTERIAADLFEADVFINMPIAKHHGQSGLTLSMKNLMGVNWDRIRYHQTDLDQCIAELASAVRSHLVIMDANHVLLTNGPMGPGDVLRGERVIAGTDMVAVDAFTANAFWGDASRARHIRIAYDLGVGEMDLAKLSIREFEA
jgi:uncharacterized protein (DUF362 family)